MSQLNTAATTAGTITVAATISGPIERVKSPTLGASVPGAVVTTRIMKVATVQIAHAHPMPTIASPMARSLGSIAPARRNALRSRSTAVRGVSGASNVATVNVGNTTSFSTEVGSGNYFVRVRAVNELGESDPSDEIEIHTPGAPQAPSGLVTINASGPVDLRWNASAGGYAATGYVIEAGSAPGLSDLARLEVGNVTRFVTYAPPGVYYVRVRGINPTGASLPSNEVVVRR